MCFGVWRIAPRPPEANVFYCVSFGLVDQAHKLELLIAPGEGVCVCVCVGGGGRHDAEGG